MDEFHLEQSVKMMIMRFASSLESIERAVEHTSAFVLSQSKQIDIFGLKLILSESITNAVVHGNKEDNTSFVYVKITLLEDTITIRVKDNGAGFDWKKKLEADMAAQQETYGRGLALIQAYGYEVAFNQTGNTMYLTKRLDPLITEIPTGY